MRWLQSGNKDNPFFPVLWFFAILSVLACEKESTQMSQYSKTHQLISRTSLLGFNADFPLALLHLVGGYLWMTSFILLFGPQMICVGFLRAAYCRLNYRVSWMKTVLLSLSIASMRKYCNVPLSTQDPVIYPQLSAVTVFWLMCAHPSSSTLAWPVSLASWFSSVDSCEQLCPWTACMLGNSCGDSQYLN